MKILILHKGKDSTHRMPRLIMGALEKNGHEAITIRYKNIGIQKVLALSEQYDILLMSKMQTGGSPLIKIGDLIKINNKIPIFYYMNDAITKKRNWATSQAKICSFVSGTSEYTCNKFKESGSSKVSQIYQGYEPEWFFPINTPKEEMPLFIGQVHDGNRKAIRETLKRKNFNIKYKKNISIPDTNGYFNKHKININFCTKRGFSNRCMRILGSGGFLLSQYNRDLEYSFGDGCVLWRTVDELIEKATYYMTHDKEREMVALRGHELIKGYTWEKQADKIIRAINGEIILDGAFNG